MGPDVREAFPELAERRADRLLRLPHGRPLDPLLRAERVRLGMEQRLLDSEGIWLCVSCMTCNTRCPKGVRIAELIESMRQVKLPSGRMIILSDTVGFIQKLPTALIEAFHATLEEIVEAGLGEDLRLAEGPDGQPGRAVLELEKMLTPEVVANYRVINHECEHDADMVQFGTTRTGAPAQGPRRRGARDGDRTGAAQAARRPRRAW